MPLGGVENSSSDSPSMAEEQFLLQLDWQKAVLAQLASIGDALIARLDVDFEGEPVQKAKRSRDWADEMTTAWEVAAEKWEQQSEEPRKEHTL